MATSLVNVLRELYFHTLSKKYCFWDAFASIYSTCKMTMSFDRCPRQPNGEGVTMFRLCQLVNAALSPSPCGFTSIHCKERTLNHFDLFCPSRATIPFHYEEVILFQHGCLSALIGQQERKL